MLRRALRFPSEIVRPTIPVGAATRGVTLVHAFAPPHDGSGDGMVLAVPATMATPQAAVVPPPATDSEGVRCEFDAFSASISHGLQAPWRQISGFTELLAREAGPTLSDTARHRLDDIAAAASHMRAMLDALLAFSRAGHRAAHPRRTGTSP